jgi:sRNA-binding carbon storage regulator CsrA
MLVLTRRSGQSIRLAPDPGLDPATPVGELFKQGPIQIIILDIGPNRLRIGIEAHSGFSIARNELPPTGGTSDR